MNSKNGQVSEDGVAFRKTAKGSWNCATTGSVGWTAGVHEWTVSLDKFADRVSVGIALGEIDSVNLESNFRYDVYCGTGFAIRPDGTDCKCFSGAMEDGNEMMVRLDMDNHTLTFGRNGRWNRKPTFFGLKDGRWFPYFVFEKKEAAISIKKQ